MSEYNYKNKSQHTLGDCLLAVGKRGTIPFTGTIVDAGTSDHGPYVKFQLDERWGFGDGPAAIFIIDLDPIEIS